MTHRPTGEPARPVRPHPADAFPDTPPPEAAGTDPAVLTALLRRHGWQRRGGAPGRYGRWAPPGPGTGTSLLVPVGRTFSDSEDLLAEALHALSRSGTSSAREILLALAVPSDEIRWSRDLPPGPGDAVAWTADEQFRTAARRTLLAAALATRARVGHHGARHRGQAAAALDGVLVGPAPDGRGLTAFVPVTTGRPLAVCLFHALHAAREAVDLQRVTGSMDAFATAVGAGVSHELTEALVTLVRGTEGARIGVDWAPAAGVPEGCVSGAAPVEFSPGDLPVLLEAGRRYRSAEPSVTVTVTGAVVRMYRSQPQGDGMVRLRVLAGADVGHLRVTLGEEDYRTAGHAHLMGLPVRMRGLLTGRSGFRRLTEAREVAPVQVDEAERDRLLKALQESTNDFGTAFGPACDD
ncbi:hypothetical protein [Streptomyces pseudogriseolus]|uniref:hypothetical protein n=1 Tax=Streptomyces pseudogriseolus TaxID=36817 RepID=UPI003FA2AD37